MKITINDQTTLGELAMLRGKYGIEYLTVSVRNTTNFIAMLGVHLRSSIVGHGASEAEAIGSAFDELIKQLGKELVP